MIPTYVYRIVVIFFSLCSSTIRLTKKFANRLLKLVYFHRSSLFFIVFVGVNKAIVFFSCFHGGLVEEGLQLFLEMKRTFGVMPQIQHYGCIVDLLGRAGKLEEAYDFIMQMPINPDAVIWRSLLAACNIHGDVVWLQ